MEKKQNTHTGFLDKNQEKKNYQTPTIEVAIVEMEYSIAAGSATTEPTNNTNGDIEAGWETGEDQEATFF
ncbi:hypothetical protein M2T78_03965 [Elizabethkingia ursingii]|uniref:hypothetical protein n=1 Tax=Elizabethkingia ursingii TaxID=1756150 RepID=UPI0020133DA1|nr:hypothetical protein [Elizabethkingia ursingii]MCL1663395.1 hypothetical protein [Elizabethkingia ursingii]